MSDKSRWSQEYDALPGWVRAVVDALRSSVGSGVGGDRSVIDGFSARVHYRTTDEAWAMLVALGPARDLAAALSAPWPPPTDLLPHEEMTTQNVVELTTALGDDCKFDQPCYYGHRVEHHAVYCHCDAWPDSPRKCRRNRDDYRHEDCPGFVTNPGVAL